MPTETSNSPPVLRNATRTRYVKIRRIGEGSYGSATLVSDSEANDRLCVIKRLKNRLQAGSDLQCANNEIRTLSRLRHPSIVSLYDAWLEEDHHLRLSMEYCPGGDLHQYLSRHPSEPVPELLLRSWVVQLLEGVEYMHESRVIHRDIKLQNIFLSHDSALVKIGDFGLSKLISSSEEAAKTQAGTPYYFSPEIAAGAQHNRKTDVWSLGVMLYIAMCRENPFKGASLRGILDDICKAEPKRVQAVAYEKFHVSYSDELCSLVHCMLTKEINARPNAAELLRLPWLRNVIRPVPPAAAESNLCARMRLSRPRTTVNIRRTPSLDSSVVGTVAHEAVVTVIGEVAAPNDRRQSVRASSAAVPGPTTLRWYHLQQPSEGWCIAEAEGVPLFEPVTRHPQSRVVPDQTPAGSPIRRSLASQKLLRTPASPPSAEREWLQPECPRKRSSPCRAANPSPTSNGFGGGRQQTKSPLRSPRSRRDSPLREARWRP